MKYKSLFTKIILFPYLFVFGSNISDQLNTILKEYDNKSFVPIIIEINDNFDIENLKIQFIEENVPVKKDLPLLQNQCPRSVSKVKNL